MNNTDQLLLLFVIFCAFLICCAIPAFVQSYRYLDRRLKAVEKKLAEAKGFTAP
jgi:F0F1-type ATP synthase membrane subunit b/b'